MLRYACLSGIFYLLIWTSTLVSIYNYTCYMQIRLLHNESRFSYQSNVTLLLYDLCCNIRAQINAIYQCFNNKITKYAEHVSAENSILTSCPL